MASSVSRREVLIAATVGAAVAAPSRTGSAEPGVPASAEPFLYGFNTSTIRGQKLPFAEVVDIVAAAGYGGIEPWIDEIDRHAQGGGSLDEVAKRLRDGGVRVGSAIAFPEWIVDDDARRAKGLEEAKRCMDVVARIGGTRIAAPPAGATKEPMTDLRRIAERYRALLELGDRMGVVPQVEVWGGSKTLSRLSEAVFVAAESGHPKACVLADTYHLHKGGSPIDGLRLLGPSSMFAMHLNDYPADPPRDTITDAHRVYPGDGVAPLGDVFRILRDIGFRGMLSLELFNRDLWAQDPRAVAKTGLEKMRAAVRKELGA